MNYEIEIKMINVRDGDAIIVLLSKDKENLLLLIDGGHPSDAAIVIAELQYFLEKTRKKAPDLVVCTITTMTISAGWVVFF